MTTRERYNEIIEYIEELVNSKNDGEYLKPRDIALKVKEKFYFGEFREFNSLFKFLTNSTLQDYIRERKMQAVYKKIISSGYYNANEAVEQSGYGDQSAFNKQFKKEFDVTPTVAREDKDVSRIKKVKDWKYLTSSDTETEPAFIVPTKTKTFLGIPVDALKKHNEALNLQEIFEFSKEDTEIAFELSERLGTPLKETFDFYEDIILDQGHLDTSRLRRVSPTRIVDKMIRDYSFQTRMFQEKSIEYPRACMALEFAERNQLNMNDERDYCITRTFAEAFEYSEMSLYWFRYFLKKNFTDLVLYKKDLLQDIVNGDTEAVSLYQRMVSPKEHHQLCEELKKDNPEIFYDTWEFENILYL